MRTSTTKLRYLILTALTILCAGCTIEKPVGLVTRPDSAGGLVGNANTPRRFQDPAEGAPTAIESAMELSAKYAKLSDEMAVLKQKNQQLLAENQDLKDRLAPCQAQLVQAQKELGEANDLLIEMRVELNNWQANVIGFRDEMRDADKAQLEALLKILQVLGGETKTQSVSDLKKDSVNTTPQEPNRTQQESPQAGTTTGDLNG
jgi:septal ring factor EnvC (AmiA/AmiB activator)